MREFKTVSTVSLLVGKTVETVSQSLRLEHPAEAGR